jgi:hypothetical protein
VDSDMTMAAAATGDTTINRVRLQYGGCDSLAARLNVERLLGTAARVPGLRPAAILCVNRLRDPLPRTVDARSLTKTARWERSLHDSLSDLARRAARPARGVVGGDADAVLFDDRAQMLACLAADWCSGNTAARWWWRALFRGSVDVRALMQAFLERPEHSAAAIEELARLGSATRFVRHLSRGNARLMLDAIVTAHNLRELARAIASPSPSSAFEDGAAGAWHELSTRVRQEHAMRRDAVVAPWRDVVPEADVPELKRDQQLLLGVALALRRRPALVRSERFAVAVGEWRTTSSEGRRQTLAAGQQAIPPSRDGVRTRMASDAEASTAPSPVVVGVDSIPFDDTRVDGGVTPPVVATTVSLRELERGAPPEILCASDVHTELGGLFYLLNVAIALGYYGDFTAPRYRNLEVSIWDFVDIVGRALVRRDIDDPVWSLIAGLAGRAADEAPDRRSVRRIRPLVAAVRTRLAAALGCRTRAALVRMVLLHRAQVLSTATHLDIVFSLAELPIEIRMSGLDRDPGWIPAADRIVAFHFE